MKTLCVIPILFGICLFCTKIDAAEWAYYTTSHGNEIHWFYDRESASFTLQDIVRVWIRGIFSEEGVRQEILMRTKNKLPTEGFDELDQVQERWEIDCKSREYHLLTTNSYNKKGTIIERLVGPKDSIKSSPNPPESILVFLRKVACQSQPKETKKKK
jgi:hypothetical protein